MVETLVILRSFWDKWPAMALFSLILTIMACLGASPLRAQTANEPTRFAMRGAKPGSTTRINPFAKPEKGFVTPAPSSKLTFMGYDYSKTQERFNFQVLRNSARPFSPGEKERILSQASLVERRSYERLQDIKVFKLNQEGRFEPLVSQ
jgi:hypothetical protein